MIELSGGKSEKNRISFFTNNNGATATIDEEGKISVTLGNEQEASTLMGIKLITRIFGTLSLSKALIIIPLIQRGLIAKIFYLFPMFFFTLFTIICVFLVRILYGTETAKNHGAEHMAAAAYTKLKRIPTIDEIKKYSRINKHCGITIFSAFITANLIGFLVYIYTGYIIPEILIYLAPSILRSFFPFYLIGNLLQFFTTSKPDDINLELAITALTELEKIEIETKSKLDEERRKEAEKIVEEIQNKIKSIKSKKISK